MGRRTRKAFTIKALGSELFLLAFLCVCPLFLFAQNTQSRSDTLSFSTNDTLQLSQKYLTPTSLRITTGAGEMVPANAYEVIPMAGQVVLRDSSFADQELIFSYRFFPRFLPQTFALRSFRVEQDSTGDSTNFIVVTPDPGKEVPFIIPSNVKRSGSISRGITVGNNQSLAVSSGLRLELAGDLGDDLQIRAAITDENIPIQPDGTTQQIQDFDRVFIQLIRQNDSIILGDFEINHRGTQFANFYRNVQGIGVRVKEKNFYAGINGAVAKGKFNTNSFIGEEGKQGPYRLTGKNGERFIIVLAGSEKVFLNGKQMKRGEGFDYVMDYNSGELRFTSQQIISTASRIVVDFEYTDRFYNRSLMFADFGAQMAGGKLRISGSYGRDADNQNAPIDGAFSDEALDSLRQAGDNLDLAFVTGIDSVGPASVATALRYARRDTLFNGVSYERYVFSSDTDAVYQVIFTNVGTGNGFYQRNQSLVNGTVFTWLPPDSSGQPTGNFAPIRVLVPAKLHQVFDVKMTYDLSDKVQLYTEGALSDEDLNRQSPVDDDDNVGLANKTGIRVQGVKLNDSLTVRADVSHRYVEKRYNNIDRVYKVEYGREWNFDDLGERLTENVTEGTTELRYSDKVRVLANAGVRTYGTQLFSVKQLYEAESRHKWLQGKYTFTTISTENRLDQSLSRWDRHNGDIYKTFGNIRVGTEIWLEDKENTRNDSAQVGTFRFQDLKPYVKYQLKDRLDLVLSYNYRKEYEYLDSLVRDKSEAHTQYLKVIWQARDNLSFQNTSSLRRFDVLDTAFFRQNLTDNQTFITNLQASYFTKNRLIFSNLIYEATSEQLARQQVAYIEVNPGQGDYEWTDLDDDGVQDLDEFQYSTNPNRSNFFSRIVVPTQQLFPTTALNFSGNLKLDLKKTVPRSKNFFKETARNFLSISNFRVSQKKTVGTELDNYLIDIGDIFADTSLLDAQYTLRQDFYFYRNNRRGDIKLSYVDNQSKNFLESGTETRTLTSYGSNQRLNIGKSKSVENEFKWGTRTSFAESFNTRNYRIDFIEVNPKMNFQINRKIRLTAGYTYKYKENTNDDLEVDAVVNLHKLSFDAKVNLKERNNIFAKLDLVQVGQTGEANFAAEFELRETLDPGFNAVWQVFTTIYLTKTLELSVTYDGRASAENRTLHTGRVQLKAFF